VTGCVLRLRGRHVCKPAPQRPRAKGRYMVRDPASRVWIDHRSVD